MIIIKNALNKRYIYLNILRSGLAIMLLNSWFSASAQTPGGPQLPNAVPVSLPATYTTPVINYVRTWEPAIATTDTAFVVNPARITAEVRQTTQYFDGLGRPLQTVAKALSPGGKDLVTPVVYDAFGREQTKYLPYAASAGDGKFKTDPFTAQKIFYGAQTPGESVYYSRMDYEPSPLNRVMKTYAPGNSWAKNDPTGVERGGNHPIETQYLVNTTTDAVRIWDIPVNAVIPTSTSGRVYAAGQLYKNLAIDEAGNQVIEYKDKQDRVVLKKVQISATPGADHAGWLCTYYVYDDLGSLRFVIPPRAVELASAANWVISTSVAEELCFIYRYDGRNRMIIKKVPGADSTELVYDVRDRLAFIRDGNLKGKSWLATFYDGLNRPVMTAIYNSPASREILQTSMNTATGSSTQNIKYDFPVPPDLILDTCDNKPLYQAANSVTMISSFDTPAGAEITIDINPAGTTSSTTIAATNTMPGITSASLTPLTYTYYDDYTFPGKQNYASGDISQLKVDGTQSPEPLPAVQSNMTKGLVTGTRVRVLGTNQWLTTTNHYNDKGRLIQVLTENINSGVDVLTNLYDFNGKVLSTYQRHKNLRSGTVIQTTMLTMMVYDGAGRLLTIKKRMNDAAATSDKVIVANDYDELGQLKQKRLGIKAGGQLETLKYDYNIRGWLTGINKDFVRNPVGQTGWFGQTLSYDNGFTTPQYNGNIAGINWRSLSDTISRAYGYTYDKANRLLSAAFTQQNKGSQDWTNNQKDFSVSNITYDANGNLLTMNQKGMIGTQISPIDQLTYRYKNNGSNKLAAVDDPINTSSAKLGDFINGTNTGDDYSYDNNGNLIADLNKNIHVCSNYGSASSC